MEFLRQRQARWTSPGAASRALLCLVLLSAAPGISLGNIEVDALHALRQALDDPAQVLESWDPSSSNPCAWFHVTCNTENSVLRIDLGDAELSGSLVPELGQLSQLQYLEIFDNNITGAIPAELGNLTKLVSLDLYDNDLTGAIPGELGNTNLTYLRLNNNSLSGEIPEELTNLYNLEVLDLSYNFLIGPIPVTGAFAFFGPGSFAGNPGLFYPARPPAEAPAPAPALSSRRSTLQQIGLSSPQLISTAVPLIELIVALSCALLAWG